MIATQTDRLREIRRTNLELIFSDHNAYCLPPCQNKCPSHIDIPGFLKANAESQFRESARIFKRTIPFPSILGRVCPAPCEDHCRRDEVDEAIAIRDSHRYAGDQVLKSMWDENIDPPLPFELQPKTGKRVAVIGSGPAGASAAFYLLVAGHDVTIFEKDPEPGGMLRYGIPQYRLPKIEVLDGEYQSITRLGGRFECGKMLGRDFTTADLKRAPSNFSKSGRDGRRGAAAQHTHYGAVHMDAGQPRAMRSSSAPPGACSARSRAPHALSSRFSPRFSSRFSERQTDPTSHTKPHSKTER